MATCKLGRWDWNGLSAASRPMSRMLEHRHFDFRECRIQTRIPERIRNLRGLQTSTVAERRPGVRIRVCADRDVALVVQRLADLLVGKCWARRSVIAGRLHLGQIAG